MTEATDSDLRLLPDGPHPSRETGQSSLLKQQGAGPLCCSLILLGYSHVPKAEPEDYTHCSYAEVQLGVGEGEATLCLPPCAPNSIHPCSQTIRPKGSGGAAGVCLLPGPRAVTIFDLFCAISTHSPER